MIILGAGHFCPFPFVFEGVHYDQCTRKKLDGSNEGTESYYWCPSPFNVTYSDSLGASLFSKGGEAGRCTDFPVPKGYNYLDYYHIESNLSTPPIECKPFIIFIFFRKRLQ